jgi:N-acetylneuraminic acid mutarotase
MSSIRQFRFRAVWFFACCFVVLIVAGAVAVSPAGARGQPDGAAPLQGTPTATTTACVPQPAAWLDQAAYPSNIYWGALTAQSDLLYSFGGLDGAHILSTTHSYNASTNVWTSLAPLPNPRVVGSAVSDGTYLYILGGGEDGITTTHTVFRYDPGANSYTTLAPIHTGTGGQAVVYLNGKIYRIGGCIDAGCTSISNTVEAYTISSDTWVSVANYPIGVVWLSAVAYDKYIYTAGAAYVGADAIKTYRYDPGTNTWDDAAISDLPAPRYGAAAGLLNSQFVLAGGVVNGLVGNSTIALDLSNPTGSWTPLADMNHAVYWGLSAALGGQLYAVGGSEGSGPTNFNQRYAPAVTCASPTATVGPPTATVTTTALAPTITAIPSAPTRTATRITSPTVAASATRTLTRIASPTATSASHTPTPCAITFSDVQLTDYFYVPVRYLYCDGVISGYTDGTFRPFNNTTRAQMVKIVVLGFGLAIQTPMGGAHTFHDVAPSDAFFSVIETAAAQHIVAGYTCGGVAPGPCDPQQRPYFLPNTSVTRGQLSKIAVGAAGWPLRNPPSATFTDVALGSAFYAFVETAVCHGVVSGYADQTFRPGANATRGQISKIVYLSLTNPAGACNPAAAPK